MKKLLYSLLLIGSMTFTVNGQYRHYRYVEPATYGNLMGVDTSYRIARHEAGLDQRNRVQVVIVDDYTLLQEQAMRDSIARIKRPLTYSEINTVLHRPGELMLPPLHVKTPDEMNAMTNHLFLFRLAEADTNNSARCQYQVGVMYLNGQGTVTNKETGLEYIKRASTNGNSDAVSYLKSEQSITKK